MSRTVIINETIGILRDKFKQDPYTLNDNFQKLRALGNLVKPTETLNVITEDPPDNRILECSQAARSDYIVSEDKDLCKRRAVPRRAHSNDSRLLRCCG